MFRSEEADLSDLKLSALAGGACGILAAAAVCGAVFDARSALLGAGLAGLRGADGYAEVGQAVWIQRGEFAAASKALVVRSLLSTAVVIAMLSAVDVSIAILAGFVVRLACAAVETEISRRQRFRLPAFRAVARTFGVGSWVSLASAAILLVDTLPTLAVARFAGLSDAALIAPLGRIRFGVIFLATTLVEIHYAEMARRANAQKPISSALFSPLAQFGVGTLFATPLLVFGGAQLIFGSRLGGQMSLVSLTILSGAAMGLCNLVSAGLTAQARILVQIVAYGAAGAVAVGTAYVMGWSLKGMYVGQSLGCFVALGILGWLGYARSRSTGTEPGAAEVAHGI